VCRLNLYHDIHKLTHTVSYDTGYDDAGRSLTALSCSDGANGLITKYGWQNQGAVAGFPRIGGYMGVAGWNSPQVSYNPFFHSLQPLTDLNSAVPAMVSHTTERLYTFLLLTTPPTASTSLRRPWTILPTARLRLSVASRHSMLRSRPATADCKSRSS
jgi:hypothetical protein